MIKEIQITNFYSIKDTQTLSFEISKKDMLDNSSFISSNKNMLNKIITVIGNNASGKTNILKGLAFLLWFSSVSYQVQPVNAPTGVMPHKLSNDPNSKFSIIFENGNNEFQYKLELNSQNVVYEFLGIKKERGYSTIYEIQRNKDSDEFIKWNLSKINENDKNRFSSRKNITLFSFLLSTGHLAEFGFTQQLNMYNTNLGLFGMEKPNRQQIYFELTNSLNNLDTKNYILKYLKLFGLGIDDFIIKEQDVVTDPINQTIQKNKMLIFKHKTKEDKEFDLLFFQESDGTQNIMYLLNMIVPILKQGGIIIMDEIESSIHPYLIKKIINLIMDPETNPNNAQLLFSTHQPWLLEDRTKTQIYLVEKDENLETELYRLDEVEGVRNDDNFCNKYLAGAYGAVAEMRWF